MAKKPTTAFDPRRMMQKAVEVMRESVAERRADGSPSPKVGAVLVRPDGSVVTAARGELRDGNHAEFLLLERKCVGERLDGCVLFTTLEPCLNRNHPKRGCARHIVSARIQEVYIGVEDDNPAVAGKGIEHLRRAGVTIHMFDRDLQEVILAENQAFFEWARLQPAQAAEEPIKLSVYEDAVAAVELADLSIEALDQYRTAAGIEPAADSPEFHRLLRQQGLLVEEDGAIRPSGFGLLLFGKRPRNAVPQAGLLARADLPDGTSARREFGEALVLIPGLLEEWLQTVLPSTVDRSRMERKEQVDLPFEMIREAVVNALVHRDYDLAGEKCQLVVDSDTIRVKSPGGPIPPITLDQLKAFTAPMKSRNPQLHYVFARMGMAEEQGFGLAKTLKRDAEVQGLPLPDFAMEGDYLVLTIFRSVAAATSSLPPAVRDQLTKAELAGWEWFSTRDRVTTAEYEEAMGIPNRTAKNHISKLVKLGLLRRKGAGPATFYEVVRP
ncbi:MAG: ATP-binding protein [Acidobacteriota bacterium]